MMRYERILGYIVVKFSKERRNIEQSIHQKSITIFFFFKSTKISKPKTLRLKLKEIESLLTSIVDIIFVSFTTGRNLGCSGGRYISVFNFFSSDHSPT